MYDRGLAIRIKIGITFFYRFHRCPIQLVVISCRPFVTFVTWSTGLGCLSWLGRLKKLRKTRPADDVTKVTKDLQERTQLIELDDGETDK